MHIIIWNFRYQTGPNRKHFLEISFRPIVTMNLDFFSYQMSDARKHLAINSIDSSIHVTE